MPNETKQVRTGVQVDIDLIDSRGDRDPMRVVIARGDTADVDSGVLASSAPLARAILGKREGAEIAYRRGDIVTVRIVRVGDSVDSVNAATKDAVARRQEAVQKAVDDAERTNAATFASSFTSKWGGYDAGDDIDWEEIEREEKEDDNGQAQT
ncbi:MAG: GreA/GreB family elongation factor [Caldilineaceae bacterium]|nr:GreA/GreB family elongation factor [Caldilineaceae bacterium]